LHVGLDVFARGFGVGVQAAQTAGQHRAHGPGFVQGLDHLGQRDTALRGFNRLRQDVGRHDLVVLQLQAALQDQGHSQDGAQNQGPDGPASRLYDGQQEKSFPVFSVPKRLIIGE
jgi:hypothetical protein